MDLREEVLPLFAEPGLAKEVGNLNRVIPLRRSRIGLHMAGNMVAPFVPAFTQHLTSLEAAGIDNCWQKLYARSPTL